MRLFPLLVAAAGLISTQGARAAPGSVLQTEERLSAPVTLRVREAPLCDVVAQVSRETGVPLATSEDTADERVTLFARERPAREVLGKIAEHLDYSWVGERRKGKRTLILVQDLASKRHELALRPNAERDLQRLRDFVERQVQEANNPEIRELRKLPLQQRMQRLDELDDALVGPFVRAPNGGFYRETNRPKLDPEVSQRLIRERRLLTEATPEAWDFSATAIATLAYAALPPPLREALWKGDAISLAYPPERGRVALSLDRARDMVSGGLGHLSSGIDETTGRPLYTPFQGVERVRVTLGLEAHGHQPRLQVRLRTLGSFGDAQGRTRVEWVVHEPIDPTWVGPRAPVKQASLDAASLRLREPVTLPAPKRDPRIPTSPGFPDQKITSFEDALEHLAGLLPYPILADGYLESSMSGTLIEGEKPLHVALARIAHVFDRNVRFQDGYLLFRHVDWAVKRSEEPPARLVRRWQESIGKYGALRFADLLQIAGRLTPQQTEVLKARLVEPTADGVTYLLEEDLKQSGTVLRLLHSLPPAVMRALEQGHAVPLQGLPAGSLRLAARLVAEGGDAGAGYEHTEDENGVRFVPGSGFAREDELERLFLQSRISLRRKPIRWLWSYHNWVPIASDEELKRQLEEWREQLPQLKAEDVKPIEGEMIEVDFVLPGAEPISHVFLHPTRQLAPEDIARTGVVLPLLSTPVIGPGAF